MSEVGIDGLADTAREAADRDLQVAIRKALDSLPQGESTGVCVDCGGEIERARLALLPGTTQCAACAQRRKRLSAQIGN